MIYNLNGTQLSEYLSRGPTLCFFTDKTRYQQPKDISPSHSVKESEKNILWSVLFFLICTRSSWGSFWTPSSVCSVEISSVYFMSSCRQTNQPTHSRRWKQTFLMKHFLLKRQVKCPSDSKHHYYLEVRISCLRSLFFFSSIFLIKLKQEVSVWGLCGPGEADLLTCGRGDREWSLEVNTQEDRPTSAWGNQDRKLKKGGGRLWECGESQTLFWAGREGIPRASTGGSTKSHICRDGSDRNRTHSGCTESDVNVSRCHACTSPLVNQEHHCMSDSLITSHCDH